MPVEAMESTARTAERPDVARIVREHPRRAELSALCFDVLCRRRRPRLATGSRKYVRGRARVHNVQRRDAATPFGNLLDLLERGSLEGSEQELTLAFAMGGLEDVDPADEALGPFVGLVDVLARTATADPYRHLRSLSPGAQQRLAQALARTLEDEGPPAARTDAVGRLLALASLDGGKEHLERLPEHLDDPLLSACAASLLGRRDSLAREVGRGRAALEGEWVAPEGSPFVRGLTWLSGWALLRRVGRSLGWLVRRSRYARVSLEGRVLRVERVSALLGRGVHQIDESLRAEDVSAVVRDVRRPVALALLGVACLVAGLVGLGLAIDAALRQGRLTPLWWGLCAVGAGAGLDLLLDYVAKRRRQRVWLEIRSPERPPVRLAGVEADAARQLLEALDAAR